MYFQSDANIIYISKDSGVTFQHLAISALSVTIVSVSIKCVFLKQLCFCAFLLPFASSKPQQTKYFLKA